MKRIVSTFFLLILALVTYAQPSADKLIRQGIAYHDQEKYMEAISCYQQALKVNPASMSAVYEMSLSYLKMKDYDNAIINSTQVIKIGFKPLLVDAYVVKGTSLAAQNKLDDAISLFSQAIKESGDEYLLHYNLGLSYYNKGNLDQSEIHLAKAIECDATYSGTFLLYAYVLRDLNKWIESFYSYHFFLLLEPNTKRSVDAFKELYSLLSEKDEGWVSKLDGEWKTLYNKVQSMKPRSSSLASQYTFFEEASKEIFIHLSKNNKRDSEQLLWSFFVPVFTEILESSHFSTYCRYITVSCFPESHDWWEKNREEVDNFIDWFERGEDHASEEDAYFDEE